MTIREILPCRLELGAGGQPVVQGVSPWRLDYPAPCPTRFSQSKIHGLTLFIAGDAFQAGIVFYDGEATLSLDKEAGIRAVPLSKLWTL